MVEDWIGRWEEGRIGWHQVTGNAYLKQHWPDLSNGSAVLVPLSGKSVDLIWLAAQGLTVVGIELSDIAIKTFFDENELEYTLHRDAKLDCYAAKSAPIRLYCGNYFDYGAEPAAALYDRGALATLSATDRPRYIEQTKSLLRPDAFRMVITLEYDQEMANGPPFSVLPDELLQYWPDLRRADSHNDIENCPPKFRAAGITEILEAVWVSG